MAECMFGRVLNTPLVQITMFAKRSIIDIITPLVIYLDMANEYVRRDMAQHNSLNNIIIPESVDHFPKGIFTSHKFTKAHPFKSVFPTFLFFILHCKHSLAHQKETGFKNKKNME